MDHSTASPVRSSHVPGNHEAHYDALRASLQNLAFHGPLFTTDTEGLWDAYLAFFPAHERQHYNCRACQKFIETYGGLVYVDDGGNTQSLIWANERSILAPRLRSLVEKATITGVFITAESTWGTIQPYGTWHHLAVIPLPTLLYRGKVKTPFQEAAEKNEDRRILGEGLASYSKASVMKAATLLETDALYRSEKGLGVAQWLLKLMEQQESLKGRSVASRAKQSNLLWRAAASAPPGFCHIRSSMIGTLLDDIQLGLPMDDVAAKFRAKMHPLQYQRPTAPPKEGTINQAEKVMAALQSAGSLNRRFARLDDIEAVWRPRERGATPPAPGVFGHLRSTPAPEAPSDVEPMVVTWEKFARTVLATAASIEVLIPAEGVFCALVTAAAPDSPPILQWDNEHQRNPVSVYTYTDANYCSRWNLMAGTWLPVTAATLLPHQWHGGGFDHQGRGVMFLLPDCRDVNYTRGAGLFVETLKSDYHGIRSVLEAHFRQAVIQGSAQATACGLALTKKSPPIRVRVTTTSNLRMGYTIDRWD